MDAQQPPLSYVASAASQPHISQSLPPEVITCLKNARFLHLATCDADMPHISLMNYTYLPSTPYRSTPVIIMTTNPSSKKTLNLQSNPKVALLVHDWVSHRPPSARRENSPHAQRSQSGLAQMLMNMNTQALSRISATINGEANMVDSGSEEETWCKDMHLQNNTFDGSEQTSADLLGTSPGMQPSGDGGRNCYIQGEAVRVVVVTIKDGRIADWKGGVTDWAIAPQADHTAMINGV